MIRFNCDYSEGAHPRILERLLQTNLEQTEGYGTDNYCRSAAEKIREQCAAPKAQVHFLMGGTQANLTVIAASLRPWQGVIGADTCHINVHETGAIEACGHKVLALPGVDGKITAAQVEACHRAHVQDETMEHMVQPGMVYLSQPTELGTLYTLAELEAISRVCRENGLWLYLDGARLAYGLSAAENDVTLTDLARLCDVFYIGGTKVGALFGEAVVICAPALQKDFRYAIKQRGGMLAKGRLLGIQFDTLFTNDLYGQMGAHADALADRLRDAFAAAGCPLLVSSRTNQLFPILPDAALERLKENFAFSFWQKTDETHSAVRFCTSWATAEGDVAALETALKELL